MRKFLVIVLAIVTAFFVISAIVGFLQAAETKVSTARVTVFADVSTCWSGQVGDSTQEGCGRRDLEITSDLGVFVAVVQKKSDDSKALTVRITPSGGIPKEATTTASFGVVTVSAQG